MKILYRHIGLTVILATLLVLLVLVGLQIFISFINELKDIGTGSYGLVAAIRYTFLTLPSNIYNFFPMAGLLGSLLGLGYLASNSELIVMRASGMSLLQITWAVLCAAIFLLVIVTFVGELIGPSAMHAAQDEKNFAKTGVRVSATAHGLWIHKGDDFIYIQDILPDNKLSSIYQYSFNNNYQLLSVSYAKSGIYQDGKWQLENIYETKFSEDSVSSQNIQQQTWPIEINIPLLSTSRIAPEQTSLIKLADLINYRRANGLSIQQYSLVFWDRVLQPLATLVMIFLSIPFIFGPLRTVAMGVRIVAGVLVGFAFYLLNQFIGPFSLVYQIPPFASAVFPTLLFFVVGVILMRRVR